MALLPRKDRRDLEPTNCLHETGSKCARVRAQENALGWAAKAMSPCGLVNCKVNGPVRAITDEPYDRIGHVRVRGGRREQSRPLPGSGPEPAVQLSVCSLLIGGWLRPLMLLVELNRFAVDESSLAIAMDSRG